MSSFCPVDSATVTTCAAGRLRVFHPSESVVNHAKKGGRVFGVCNGFQILCETGLLPGALLHNESRKFICKNVTLKPVSRKAPVSSALDPSTPITIPIAHGEGNYFIDDDGLKSLQDNDQVLFQYCDESGAVNAWSNPNGAVANIAGVANREMNVFGMMPHPERAASDDGQLRRQGHPGGPSGLGGGLSLWPMHGLLANVGPSQAEGEHDCR